MDDDRSDLIDRIEAAQEEFMRLHARDRSSGLLSVNLTIQQLKTLMLISFEGGMPTHDLAETLGVGMATASGNVDRLAAQGMVRRAEDPADRRIRRIELTDEGRRVLDSLINAGRQQRRRVLGRLDTTNLRRLASAMDALTEAMRAETGQS